MKNIVYLDVETQRSAQEVGGWKQISALGLSVAVTYNTRRGGYRIYSERDVHDLVTELQQADRVVGFNILRFDYTVLQPYAIFDLGQIPTVDMLLDIEKSIQHRVSLDAVGAATLGAQKTSDGLQAIRWYKEGKLLEIAEYCCYDVKLTKLVHEYGAANKQVHYFDRFCNKLNAIVDWEL